MSFTRIIILLLAAFLLHSCSAKEDPGSGITTPENALHSYLNNGDDTYGWELKDSYDILSVKAYDLLLTSQQWREYSWKHQLTIFIPNEIQYEGALLWITAGSLQDGMPEWTTQNDEEIWTFGIAALSNKAVVAVLKQTPNQPLYGDLSEDALISYTLHNFQSDGDYSWPLLFPMVKSAVRAMDAIQEFSIEEANHEITGFLVSGASKRGWTTWLTGASDSRVKAIAPAVIDILNMPVNLDYQLEVWGDYSFEIQDYVDLGIPQNVGTEQGNALATMIDPYSYRDQLKMPKLILLGTNDPYWPVDAVKHYFNDLKGENFIQYSPNAGHELNNGQHAKPSINAFFCNTFAPRPYGACSWEVSEDGTGITLDVEGSANEVKAAYLWTADSEDRDFRDELWSSGDLDVPDHSSVSSTIDYPETGFRAFYIDLKYTDLNGRDYTISTRMFVTDQDELL
jgi:PhoPQ-activated pathogenicity-related protein